jgi:putative phosphoribosyl transferase
MRMLQKLGENLYDLKELRDLTGVFRDREHAGSVLWQMLSSYKNTDALIFGIPAGGVPVAASLASKLQLDLDVAVVSKITLPWTTEAGYGAVAFDGTVKLNQDMVSRIGLTSREIEEGIRKASSKVGRRFKEFRGDKSFPDIKDHPVILVDDGIASGFTMLVAVEALRNKGAGKLIITVPTAHLQALEKVVSQVDEVYCANIRGGWGFAVADAYQKWYDVTEEEVKEILKEFD